MSNQATEKITEKKAKLFFNGHSQAVRLPKEFQFSKETISGDFLAQRDQSPPQVRDSF